MGLKLPLPIKTPRLLLRRLAPIDSKDLLDIVADEDSFRYFAGFSLNVQEVENWLESDRSTRLFQEGHNFWLAIELLEEPKVIGYIALFYRDADNRQMGFDVMVNRRYRSRGFATEGIRAAMQFAFAGLNIHRLSNWCDCRNIAAVRILEKAGFRREAHCIQARFRKDEWIDFFHMHCFEKSMHPPRPMKFHRSSHK